MGIFAAFAVQNLIFDAVHHWTMNEMPCFAGHFLRAPAVLPGTQRGFYFFRLAKARRAPGAAAPPKHQAAVRQPPNPAAAVQGRRATALAESAAYGPRPRGRADRGAAAAQLRLAAGR